MRTARKRSSSSPESLAPQSKSGFFGKKPQTSAIPRPTPMPAVIGYTSRGQIYILVHTNLKGKSSTASAELFGPLDLTKDLKGQIKPKYSWEAAEGNNPQSREDFYAVYKRMGTLRLSTIIAIGNVFDLIDKQMETIPALADRNKKSLRKLCHPTWASALNEILVE